MILKIVKVAAGSIVLRAKLLNYASATGQGITGLTFSSTGLRIAAILDDEATTTAYTAAGGTIETVTTLGTYVAPTATKCRFKEIDATNHPGWFEFQFADARFGVTAKGLTLSIGGVDNLQEADGTIQLWTVDPYAAAGVLGADLIKVGGDAAAVTAFARMLATAHVATVSGTPSTTVIAFSNLPAGLDNDALAGKVLSFPINTTTATLRGEGRLITAFNGTTKEVTVAALTSVPVVGDIAVIG